jgi:hypothetical protein
MVFAFGSVVWQRQGGPENRDLQKETTPAASIVTIARACVAIA